MTNRDIEYAIFCKGRINVGQRVMYSGVHVIHLNPFLKEYSTRHMAAKIESTVARATMSYSEKIR